MKKEFDECVLKLKEADYFYKRMIAYSDKSSFDNDLQAFLQSARAVSWVGTAQFEKYLGLYPWLELWSKKMKEEIRKDKHFEYLTTARNQTVKKGVVKTSQNFSFQFDPPLVIGAESGNTKITLKHRINQQNGNLELVDIEGVEETPKIIKSVDFYFIDRDEEESVLEFCRYVFEKLEEHLLCLRDLIAENYK